MKRKELIYSGNLLKYILVGLIVLFFISAFTYENVKSEKQKQNKITVIPFGSGGQVKMIYDRRMRPQSVFMNNKQLSLHLIMNGIAVILSWMEMGYYMHTS